MLIFLQEQPDNRLLLVALQYYLWGGFMLKFRANIKNIKNSCIGCDY